ncbi:regulatory-associated protein of TOR 1-like isoform X2 [Rhodamnia argentea]|uniref:Regulatory-associated protein of TOR 1-like isoform X2 n=1 Tax=Rhodamnia argentea TaxID=178133 RepID=A0ABM3HLU0_9MYRT|nr:regulatory-associated protein of TOR 1-like isoform X2 [Rhodamnia argentea]
MVFGYHGWCYREGLISKLEALGDVMASRFSQSTVSVGPNGFDHCGPSSSSGDGDCGRSNLSSLPQNVVLCELHHGGSEARVPCTPSEGGLVSKWRLKNRIKTGCVAIVLCLNISVDPPDVIKTSPCARMECWIDPLSMQPRKAIETIAEALKKQYRRWQLKSEQGSYQGKLDPTIDGVKKLCTTCRQYAKSERVLFHYNGHGVPKPTTNGDIWVFNKSYTQYMPLLISELDSWLRTPSIYVFDCSAAGSIVHAFIKLNDWCAARTSESTRDCIILAACEVHETLPQSAEFPADVFTSCLTTPIKMALRWLCTRSLLSESLDYSLIDKIPGRPDDRKTPLGELNWIFTAVTDAIAWNVLPHDLFQRLFRQDLLVASLFRNFLLAERIMRSANCSPISHPALPPTHQHHMWDAWDMAAEICLSQLSSLVEDSGAEFLPSPFFTEQLTAFEAWLDHGSKHKKPPEQLPIVLQVLLGQSHRFQALVLLARFLDMGPWAVDLALSVGVFPYVLKLLRTPTPELWHILLFVWTKILSLDKSCQVDLVRIGGHTYFIRFLESREAYPEHCAMAAFVLAVIVDGHRRGQEVCVEADLIHVCLRHLRSPNPNGTQTDPLFLQWLALCLGKIWEDFLEAQMIGVAANAPAIFDPLLSEPQPEVRASAVFALGTLLDVGSDSGTDGVSRDEEYDDGEKTRAEISIIKSLLSVVSDSSPLVKAEVAVAIGRFAFGHNEHLRSIATACWKPQSSSLLTSLPSLAQIRGTGSGCTPIQLGSIVSSQMGPLLRSGSNSSWIRDSRVSSSNPLVASGVMHGSPSSDDSSENSDSALVNDGVSNGVANSFTPKPLDKAIYSQCISAMRTLAKDPSPRTASLGRHVLSIMGIEQVETKSLKNSSISVRPGETVTGCPSLAGLARSTSWFDMRAMGMRRVCSLESRPYLTSSPESGLADAVLASGGTTGAPERSFLLQSTIYNWSCRHFSKPILTAAEDGEEISARMEEGEIRT